MEANVPPRLATPNILPSQPHQIYPGGQPDISRKCVNKPRVHTLQQTNEYYSVPPPAAALYTRKPVSLTMRANVAYYHHRSLSTNQQLVFKFPAKFSKGVSPIYSSTGTGTDIGTGEKGGVLPVGREVWIGTNISPNTGTGTDIGDTPSQNSAGNSNTRR